MDDGFVRKDFYSEPPAKGASVEEWSEWADKDDRQASAAKAQYTKGFEHEEIPAHLMPEITNVKIGGVHRQSVNVGLTGSSESGTLAADVVDMSLPGRPEELIDWVREQEQSEFLRHKRGGAVAGKSAKRRARKAARKGKRSKAKLRLVK